MKTDLNRRRMLELSAAAWLGSRVPAAAQTSGQSGRGEKAPESRALPPESVTRHTLALPGRTLQFTANTGALWPTLDKPSPVAEIAFIAFQLGNTDVSRRPVTFAFNGGPGFASGWLNVGAVGPWRIPLQGPVAPPSATPIPEPNAETWLDFTDLVFIDPAATGYSRVLTTNEETRHTLFSVEGDIRYLAEAIRLWIDRFGRSASPKYILGESYGGLRAPLLTRALADHEGTGIAGLLLVSPALEIPGHNPAFDPFYYVTRLPSMAATTRALHGDVTRAAMADVEQYAESEFLTDLTLGESDQAAIERRVARVTAFTGLDPALVRRHHGMIDTSVFLREVDRAQGRIASAYDATVSIADPFPYAANDDAPDPIVDGLKAPVSSAMVWLYQNKLQWRPEITYDLFGPEVGRQWQWPRGRRAQSATSLRSALALDPSLRVLVAHGMFDLVTPYFSTELILDQIPAAAGRNRVHLQVYPGGHMFYLVDTSRVAWRDAVQSVYQE